MSVTLHAAEDDGETAVGIDSVTDTSTPRETPDAAELSVLLDELSVLGSVLYVAAHPDDENTSLLAALARGELARTGYLSVTRGDGGQNLIGTERGELLGLIRTQELLAARRLDGAEQFFTRAVDFGYTKSVDEALETWGHEEVLGDVVRVIRTFRPDVVVMRFPGDGRGGHGQHTASAVLSAEAFEAAADPARFPEQLTDAQGLEPWQATRLLWDVSRFFGPSEESDSDIVIDVGAYSPRLGESFTEISARSRSMHKSQGFGASAQRGSQENRLQHRAGKASRGALFDDVDTSWSRVGGEQVEVLVRRAAREFDLERPHAVVPLLLEALRRLQDVEKPRDPWVRHKRADIADAVLAALGARVDLLTPSPTASPGDSLELTLEAVQRSPLSVTVEGVRLPLGAGDRRLDSVLVDNLLAQHSFEVTVPVDQPSSQPYWLEEPAAGDRGALFRVPSPGLIGQPESRPIAGVVTLRVEGYPLRLEVPVRHRWTDRVEGERVRELSVVPRVSVALGSPVLMFPDAKAKPVSVSVRGGEAGERATVRLRLPEGWSARPAAAQVELVGGDAVLQRTFQVTPPQQPSVSEVIAEVALEDGALFQRSVETIDYRHIPVQTVWRTAAARIVRLELDRRGELVGYVEGAGDEIPEALRQVGYDVDLLSDEELASGDLSGYDAIVLGIRAYNSRAAVLEHLPRLLSYVERGGTLLSQYNTISRRSSGENEYGPYPFRISRDRVSVEDAPVTLLRPDHPVLTSPNRITDADFDGWVQERGLYFPNQWDERYTALLASNDPGEPPREGGLLVAEYGEGVYIYTGYSFFRELPAGVPGAVRLFVNLLSARQ